MGELRVERDLIDGIASQLDLRPPNTGALETLVYELSQHYDVRGRPRPFEGVVVSATAMGKTYIIAAAIDYYAALGGRNFAVIAPGKTILKKTVDNFSLGHPKSLLPGMSTRPVVITSDDFATPAMRATMDDEGTTKLFVFTVQALLKPETSEAGRRTHKYQEGLGKAFYEHLTSRPDLIVFADEHHTYYGAAFSRAVRDLKPYALVGLTATPAKRTPADQIIFRYPLAAAIAERYVKTPVLVGRKDDRKDPETKLQDGIRLLQAKERALRSYTTANGLPMVNPVMLVIAQSIEEADEYGQIVQRPSFADGAYADSVLVVHSDAPDKALEDLDKIEEPANPCRIVISVGMLKEGWDAKNVYVIASMRASVSEILTEQTLGRGLRLPFGKYTGVELLDTLEVLAHERYQELLKKANVINEQFIDYRTRSVLTQDSSGHQVAVSETTEVARPVIFDETLAGASVAESSPTTILGSTEARMAQVEAGALALQVQLVPRPRAERLMIPLLKMDRLVNPFSLADITDRRAFRELGERIAANPENELVRTRVSARVISDSSGGRHTELVTSRAADRVESAAPLLPLEAARALLAERLLAASITPARAQERAAMEPLLDAFFAGLGPSADVLLSSYMDRASERLIGLVTDEQRKSASQPNFTYVTELVHFNKTRLGRPVTSSDRFGAFSRGVGYEGWVRSMYSQVWFDSGTERDVAVILDDADEVSSWVRLHVGDLPILWSDAGNFYNPDFIAVETDATHWIVEAKMDKEMESVDVQKKREAALRWANHVSTDEAVGKQWRYLLVSETDVKDAKGSWSALKSLGGA